MQAWRVFHPRVSKGFTLIELVVTLALLGLIAGLAAPLAELAVTRSKEQELRSALREIRTAIDRYKLAYDEGHMLKSPLQSGYPPNLSVLVNGVKDVKDINSSMMYFMRRLPRDPFATDTTLTTEKTWGIRCSKTPPDKPQECDGNDADVYDVYSLSERSGINGMPYKDW